jgi:hypothetical protein
VHHITLHQVLHAVWLTVSTLCAFAARNSPRFWQELALVAPAAAWLQAPFQPAVGLCTAAAAAATHAVQQLSCGAGGCLLHHVGGAYALVCG